jgi:hypothetical protein
MQKPKNIHEKSVETWYPGGDQTKQGWVKIATRVRKGAIGGNRPGTFEGSTNYRQRPMVHFKRS